jgi:hypothetical protein
LASILQHPFGRLLVNPLSYSDSICTNGKEDRLLGGKEAHVVLIAQINSTVTREFCDNIRSINTAESAGCASGFGVAYAENVV